MNKAEAKRYVEENITIMSMIISSSHSYIYHIFFKFYTIAGRCFSSVECFIHKQSNRDRERQRQRRERCVVECVRMCVSFYPSKYNFRRSLLFYVGYHYTSPDLSA